MAARLGLAWFSAGTSDAELWSGHAAGVAREGLTQHYADGLTFNHPPPIAWLAGQLWQLAGGRRAVFAALFRTLVTLCDLTSGLLLWVALRGQARRLLWVAGYLLAPVAIVLAGQHCNSDAMVGTCLLASVILAGRQQAAWAGVMLGLSAWIKLPGLLAVPAVVLALPTWRDRRLCLGTLVVVLGIGFGPAYLSAERFAAAYPDGIPYNVMVERVFGYRGHYIRTGGPPITFVFGPKNFLIRMVGDDFAHWPAWVRLWLDLRTPIVDRSRWVAILLMVVLAFLRRHRRTTLEIGATVAAAFVLFYALVETWTFQYFAWSMVLWMLLPWRSALATHLAGGGFVYGVYAYVCHDPWLLAPWRFGAYATWPAWLIVCRDTANLVFLAVGFAALVRALVAARRPPRASDGHSISTGIGVGSCGSAGSKTNG